MKDIKVETFVLGPLETNCYLLTAGKEAVVIDCGLEPLPLLQSIRDRRLNVQAIYLTHMHFDHIGGVAELQKMTGAPVYGNLKDEYLNEVSINHGGSQEFKHLLDFETTDLQQGRLMVLESPVMVLGTPDTPPEVYPTFSRL